jgi:hypothetical protein
VTFARPDYAAIRAAEREANLRELAIPNRSLHRGSYAGDLGGPLAKPQEHRNPALLAMAKDRPCLLMVPAVCNHRTDTTVACHSNSSRHGKAGARKADDQYSVWGCFACHYWLDFGNADATHKDRVFNEAMARQILAWELIALDASEPERFRKAARWALDLHHQ